MASEGALTWVDPMPVYFTFSRIRPQFSCGRRVADTLAALTDGTIKVSDLPPIGVLVDAAGNHFSLNNRRLFAFKALARAGLLGATDGKVPARLRPVPDTKRMRDKYTPAKCALDARLKGGAEKGGTHGAPDDDDDGGGSEPSDTSDADREEGGAQPAAKAAKNGGGHTPDADVKPSASHPGGGGAEETPDAAPLPGVKATSRKERKQQKKSQSQKPGDTSGGGGGGGKQRGHTDDLAAALSALRTGGADEGSDDEGSDGDADAAPVPTMATGGRRRRK